MTELALPALEGEILPPRKRARSSLFAPRKPDIQTGKGQVIGPPPHPMYGLVRVGSAHHGDPDRFLDLARMFRSAGANGIVLQGFADDLMHKATLPPATFAEKMEIDHSPEAYQALMERKIMPPAHYAYLLQQMASEQMDFVVALFNMNDVDRWRIAARHAGVVPNGVFVHNQEHSNPVHVGDVAALAAEWSERSGHTLPVFLELGLKRKGSVRAAVNAARKNHAPGVVLLDSVEARPADPNEHNYEALPVLRRAYGLPVGFSDYSFVEGETDPRAVPVNVAEHGGRVYCVQGRNPHNVQNAPPGPARAQTPDQLGEGLEAGRSTREITFGQEIMGSPETSTPSEKRDIGWEGQLAVVRRQCGPGESLVYGEAPMAARNVLAMRGNRETGDPLLIEDIAGRVATGLLEPGAILTKSNTATGPEWDARQIHDRTLGQEWRRNGMDR